MALNSTDVEFSSTAANELGSLSHGSGDAEAAVAYMLRAYRSGHSEQAPIAAINLGVAHYGMGDMESARLWFQRAASSEHSIHRETAAKYLRILESDS